MRIELVYEGSGPSIRITPQSREEKAAIGAILHSGDLFVTTVHEEYGSFHIDSRSEISKVELTRADHD